MIIALVEHTPSEMSEDQGKIEPPTGYGEISAALEIIRGLRSDKLKLHPGVFGRPIYRDTLLFRPAPHRANEILMKNVYYLATLSPNVTEELVTTLVHQNVFSVGEGNEILQQPTSKLRGVKMFAELMQKEDRDGSLISNVFGCLRKSGNDDVINLLRENFREELHDIDMDDQIRLDRSSDLDSSSDYWEQEEGDGESEGAAVGELVIEPRASQRATNLIIPEEDGKWSCTHCTYLNGLDSNVCEICAKTKDFNPNNTIEVALCPLCTFINEAGCNVCEQCGNALDDNEGDF